MNTTNRPVVRAFFLPDSNEIIGGVKQLYRHVEHLTALGWDAAILTEKQGFRASWFESTAKTISLQESHRNGDLSPDTCILVLPEPYVKLDLKQAYDGILDGIPRVVYNQNVYYTFGPAVDCTIEAIFQFYRSPEVLQVLTVSEDSMNFLSNCIGIPDNILSRIVYSIEAQFQPGMKKRNTIHWMPRKNPGHVQAILRCLKSTSLLHRSSWEGEPLDKIPHSAVAERLNTARLFLAFGFPEGFGLPIAEAMAAGCWVVGYSGGGGSELFRLGPSQEVCFGDWTGFIKGIQEALVAFAERPEEANFLLQRQSVAVRSLYSHERERASIEAAWLKILNRYREYMKRH